MPVVSEPSIRGGQGSAPLLGHNLVRLLYLDEAGTDWNEPWMVVAGVLVHGDRDWPEINRRIDAIVEKYIPENDRFGFVFHATDIFHGSRYFDRRKSEWSDKSLRYNILCDLASIIDEMKLPVVRGHYEKNKFGLGIIRPDESPKIKARTMHITAVADCLIAADRWLGMVSPAELATVVHEDGPESKKFIKFSVRTLRSKERMKAEGFTEETMNETHLPLKRIIDTVHFVEKADARPLQLADLCAFTINRLAKSKDVPDQVRDTVIKYASWISYAGPFATVFSGDQV